MKFYDRTKELAGLLDAISRRPGLILIRGRRRVGKTALILEALKKTGGAYLYVHRKKNAAGLLSEFEGILRQEYNLPEYVKIDKWSTLYEIIFSHGGVVVMDEFQRLLDVDPLAITHLQDHWDRKGQHSGTSLILSGSNVGMIKKIILETGAPLFKRSQADLFLKPFSFSDVRAVLEGIGVKGVEEQVRIFAIAGGIPYYYALLQGRKVASWKDALEILLFNPFSPLKCEVRDTMMESFGKEHPNYYAIISAIAMGKSTKKEISDASGIGLNGISTYLYDLEDLVDIIRYEVPVTETRPKSKRGVFRISDNFFRFWFHFIYRNISYFEEEEYGRLLSIISEGFDSQVGFAFEQVCGEFMAKMNRKGRLPENFSKIGRWWSRKGDEIDIVLVGDDSVLLVECKWDSEADGGAILQSLRQKERLVEHGKKNVYYAVIARGFRSKTEDALCFDMGDIEKAL
ncbi:ATP-binding protein [Candidatus Micrarchaeota archaeon]|nr:ATP-binding protein [Candidatus Micrarchaeota archaeon]